MSGGRLLSDNVTPLVNVGQARRRWSIGAIDAHLARLGRSCASSGSSARALCHLLGQRPHKPWL